VLITNRTVTPLVAGPVSATAVPGQPTLIDVYASIQYPVGDIVNVTSVGAASLGTVQITNGGVTYTPRPGTHGNDSFTYTIGDPQGNTATGVVHVLVNTPPTAPTLTITVPHDTIGVFSGRITGAFDPDGDSITFSHDQDGSSGSVSVGTNGLFTYVRTGGGVIQADSFTYKVSDSFTSSIGTVHLVPDNQPLANPVDDTVNLVHNYRGPVTINVLANDPYPRPDGSTPIGPFGDPLQLFIVPGSGHQYGDVRINPDNTITYTPHQRTINPDGSITYTVAPDLNGLVVADSFSYVLTDPIEGVSSSSASVRIIPADQAPATPRNFILLLSRESIGHAIAINPFTGQGFDAVTGSTSYAKDPLAPDPLAPNPALSPAIIPSPTTDADGDPLHLVGGNGATGGQVQVTSPTTYLYTPSAGTTDDTFYYAVADQYACSGLAKIHVHWVNDPPLLVPTITKATDQATQVVFPTPLQFFPVNPSGDIATTVSGDPMIGDLHSISYWFTASEAFDSGPVAVDAAHGVLHDFVDQNGLTPFAQPLSSPTPVQGANGRLVVFNPDGSFRFLSIVPEGAYTFTFQASDGFSTTDPITVHVYVGAFSGDFHHVYQFDVGKDLSLVPGSPPYSEFLLSNFTFPHQPVYAIGPMQVDRGNLTVVGTSLQTFNDGSAALVPVNPYFHDISSQGLNVLGPGESLPTGRVTFLRQLWDGIVPSPPATVVITVDATKSTTFTSSNGHAVTVSLGSGPGTLQYSGTRAGIGGPQPLDFPPGMSAQDFPEGFFAFDVEGLHPGDHVAITIVLQAGESVRSYWKFTNQYTPGGTPIATNWYDFTYDPATDTGAETHATNPSIPPNEIVLHFVDGGRGDEDGAANGRILDPGGPAFFSVNESGSNILAHFVTSESAGTALTPSPILLVPGRIIAPSTVLQPSSFASSVALSNLIALGGGDEDDRSPQDEDPFVDWTMPDSPCWVADAS
jgi:hypothetical protein